MAARQRAKIVVMGVILHELENIEREKKQKKRRKRWWIREINKQRLDQGDFNNLVQELRGDEEQFFVYFRMTPQIFDELLRLVGPLLRKQDTRFRKSVQPAERLAITLRRLATGDSVQSIAFAYRRGASTVREIVYDTCDKIWEVMMPKYLKTPERIEDWKEILKGFSSIWNFPNCVGALDGKHIAIQAPRNSGSLFFNYKKFHSVVLMAMCDAHYRFTMVDIGEAGRWSDSGVFEHSEFGSALMNGEISLPPDEPLPNYTTEPFPYTIVADEAFALRTWMMRPYPGRSLDTIQKKVYNYRLSRARRTIENTFGIMVSKWRILKTTIVAEPSNVVSIAKATCVLHNYLRMSHASVYTPPGYADSLDPSGCISDGSWRQEAAAGYILQPLAFPGQRNHTAAASQTRERFTEYFSSPVGKLKWQVDYVLRT